MEAPEENYITLEKLTLISQDKGTVRTDPMRIKAPTPCVQSNAGGQLPRFDSLEQFRESAFQAGKKFRDALIGVDS